MSHSMLFQARGPKSQKNKNFSQKMSPTMVRRRKRFWVLEALKTADWRSKIGDKNFFYYF